MIDAFGPGGVSGSRELEVLERVRAIPEGFVSTYGDVSPGAPRFAGSVLFECDEPDLPWWRVVRADGSLAKGGRAERRLLAEGVPFRGRRVDMAEARLALAWACAGCLRSGRARCPASSLPLLQGRPLGESAADESIGSPICRKS